LVEEGGADDFVIAADVEEYGGGIEFLDDGVYLVMEDFDGIVDGVGEYLEGM